MTLDAVKALVIQRHDLAPGELFKTERRGRKVVSARWELIRRLREELGWSGSKIAHETGFDRSTVRNAFLRMAWGDAPHQYSGRKGAPSKYQRKSNLIRYAGYR